MSELARIEHPVTGRVVVPEHNAGTMLCDLIRQADGIDPDKVRVIGDGLTARGRAEYAVSVMLPDGTELGIDVQAYEPGCPDWAI